MYRVRPGMRYAWGTWPMDVGCCNRHILLPIYYFGKIFYNFYLYLPFGIRVKRKVFRVYFNARFFSAEHARHELSLSIEWGERVTRQICVRTQTKIEWWKMLYSSRWKFVLPSCSICSFIVAWSTHEAKKVEKGAGARIKIDPSINFVSNSQALMDFYPKSVLPIIRQTRKSLGIFFISTRFFFYFFQSNWKVRDTLIYISEYTYQFIRRCFDHIRWIK